jgi:hypothetical protein
MLVYLPNSLIEIDLPPNVSPALNRRDGFGGDISTIREICLSGGFLFFLRTSDHPGLYRVPVSGGTIQELIDLTSFRFTGAVSLWMGLDREGTPMMIRDTGTDDFYALTLDQK